MISFRYYITTIFLMFIFMVLGIFIGNSFDVKWVDNSYHSIVSSLEKRLIEISRERDQLQDDLVQLSSKYQEQRKVWSSFFIEQYGQELLSKEGVLISDSKPLMDWAASLNDFGIGLKILSSDQFSQIEKTDFVILDRPTNKVINQLASFVEVPPLVVIGETFLKPQLSQHVYYLPKQPSTEGDILSFLKGLDYLLSKTNSTTNH